MYVIIYTSKPKEGTIPKENPNVKYGLWVIMTHICLPVVTNVPL